MEEVSELDVGRLEAGERENALAFWKSAQSYALEEASYLRTRADRIEQKGPRRITEGYAQVRAIVTQPKEILSKTDIHLVTGEKRPFPPRDSFGLLV